MSKEVIVLGMKDINKYDVNFKINTTSRSEDFGKAFTPFKLGPVRLYESYIAQNVENAWQFSKVYKEFDGPNEQPTKEYFEWAQKGWNDKWGHRYPMGKGARPVYSYWNGEKLDYIEARKKIYAPLYAKAVMRTQAFKHLLDMYESGESFALIDLDAYDYLGKGMTLTDVMEHPELKMGHAFVLAMLLRYPALRKKYENQ